MTWYAVQIVPHPAEYVWGGEKGQGGASAW